MEKEVLFNSSSISGEQTIDFEITTEISNAITTYLHWLPEDF